MVDFGMTLKTLRIQHNFTQVQLAQKLGLTKSVISAYETGLRLPSYDVLINIAKIFKVSTDYLLGMDNRQEIDLSGLTPEEITSLKNLIKPMKQTEKIREEECIDMTQSLHCPFLCSYLSLYLHFISSTLNNSINLKASYNPAI